MNEVGFSTVENSLRPTARCTLLVACLQLYRTRRFPRRHLCSADLTDFAAKRRFPGLLWRFFLGYQPTGQADGQILQQSLVFRQDLFELVNVDLFRNNHFALGSHFACGVLEQSKSKRLRNNPRLSWYTVDDQVSWIPERRSPVTSFQILSCRHASRPPIRWAGEYHCLKHCDNETKWSIMDFNCCILTINVIDFEEEHDLLLIEICKRDSWFCR